MSLRVYDRGRVRRLGARVRVRVWSGVVVRVSGSVGVVISVRVSVEVSGCGWVRAGVVMWGVMVDTALCTRIAEWAKSLVSGKF